MFEVERRRDVGPIPVTRWWTRTGGRVSSRAAMSVDGRAVCSMSRCHGIRQMHIEVHVCLCRPHIRASIATCRGRDFTEHLHALNSNMASTCKQTLLQWCCRREVGMECGDCRGTNRRAARPWSALQHQTTSSCLSRKTHNSAFCPTKLLSTPILPL